ncbi:MULTISPECIES: biosynthetic arginine decarboxylase [Parachlamydia]|uniref:Arginine decarboxylase n=2 Tax=Parachlamydia acanthamoebae TaxID=83552 RepID=F8KWJ5_PARAV|nr:biosynthetic arginine decarboxylase [Parachlamydia acanthamoebae]KIA76173.1 Biosynthetic arginine decarboxylase [Parachlamydia acanthamoebae]CCB85396.1 biosynthetic arginine decarboxylase [Parachlamydia acanthamoebae UV-7]
MHDEDLYWIKRWGEEYFDVNALGHIVVKPNRQGAGGDLFELMTSLVEQGIEAPILIRFNGIVRDRIQRLNAAFQAAIREFNYRNTHQMVFPIKVNPQRHVVETVQHAGQEFKMGLEVGSKPELIAVFAIDTHPDTILLCNGYKDIEYISLALIASKLGRRTLIIIEQAYELQLVLDAAKKLGVEAEIGFRMKLSNTGSGRWKSSGGEHSKFGLFSHEIIACIETLQHHEKTHWLKLLHFHLGSQITTIESVKKTLKEASRMYTELATMLPFLSFFDVGGGLAVDYDGSKSDSDSSMNYTMEEYARDVVFAIGEACLSADVADPIIITEAGRAIVAHHSVLVTEVIDVTTTPNIPEKWNAHSKHEILTTLDELQDELSLKNCRETLHDVMELKDRVLEEFIYGTMNLKERAYAEKAIRHLLAKIRTFYKQLRQIPEELETLDKILLETYFCNFSVFQSLTDAWAIDQLFPVMPIQRLHETPSHQAILADLTCDSDGKIDSFIGEYEPNHFLRLHDYRNEPYYVGIFLVGAYQEILGGLHNLFGDTNVVHAELGANGQWDLSRLVEGDTMANVLSYVQYNSEKLTTRLHEHIERSLKAGRITLSESAQIKKKFKQALESYTYLVV